MSEEAAAYRERVEAFRARREARYRSAEGWLTLVERIPLAIGEQLLPIGTLLVAPDGHVRLRIPPGLEVTRARLPLTGLVDVAVEAGATPPDRLEHAGRWYEVTAPGGAIGRLAVRVRDPDAPARRTFTGIPFYPIDPRWRVEAALERIEPPRLEAVPRTDGGESDSPCVGIARFSLEREPQALHVYDEGGGRWFCPFSDETSGSETYGGGRNLPVDRPAEGAAVVVLDFNLAYNLPCAFNPLVSCPLPSPANRLAVAVRAGERAPR